MVSLNSGKRKQVNVSFGNLQKSIDLFRAAPILQPIAQTKTSIYMITRILRGGNVCGIENAMHVMETEERENSKPGVDNESGCPVQYPKYCPETKTCASSDQICFLVSHYSYS